YPKEVGRARHRVDPEVHSPMARATHRTAGSEQGRRLRSINDGDTFGIRYRGQTLWLTCQRHGKRRIRVAYDEKAKKLVDMFSGTKMVFRWNADEGWMLFRAPSLLTLDIEVLGLWPGPRSGAKTPDGGDY